MNSPQSKSNNNGHHAEESNTRDYRQRLVAFYNRYNPAKMTTVDKTLAAFKGKEEEIFPPLVKKYGPEPPRPNSTKQNKKPEPVVEQSVEKVPLKTPIEGTSLTKKQEIVSSPSSVESVQQGAAEKKEVVSPSSPLGGKSKSEEKGATSQQPPNNNPDHQPVSVSNRKEQTLVSSDKNSSTPKNTGSGMEEEKKTPKSNATENINENAEKKAVMNSPIEEATMKKETIKAPTHRWTTMTSMEEKQKDTAVTVSNEEGETNNKRKEEEEDEIVENVEIKDLLDAGPMLDDEFSVVQSHVLHVFPEIITEKEIEEGEQNITAAEEKLTQLETQIQEFDKTVAQGANLQRKQEERHDLEVEQEEGALHFFETANGNKDQKIDENIETISSGGSSQVPHGERELLAEAEKWLAGEEVVPKSTRAKSNPGGKIFPPAVRTGDEWKDDDDEDDNIAEIEKQQGSYETIIAEIQSKRNNKKKSKKEEDASNKESVITQYKKYANVGHHHKEQSAEKQKTADPEIEVWDGSANPNAWKEETKDVSPLFKSQREKEEERKEDPVIVSSSPPITTTAQSLKFFSPLAQRDEAQRRKEMVAASQYIEELQSTVHQLKDALVEVSEAAMVGGSASPQSPSPTKVLDCSHSTAALIASVSRCHHEGTVDGEPNTRYSPSRPLLGSSFGRGMHDEIRSVTSKANQLLPSHLRQADAVDYSVSYIPSQTAAYFNRHLEDRRYRQRGSLTRRQHYERELKDFYASLQPLDESWARAQSSSVGLVEEMGLMSHHKTSKGVNLVQRCGECRRVATREDSLYEEDPEEFLKEAKVASVDVQQHFLTSYQKEKIQQVGGVLDLFQGAEEDLFIMLRHKYHCPSYPFLHFRDSKEIGGRR